MSLKFQGIHFEKPNNSSWIKKEVLRGPFGNFEVLNGPDLYNFFRTGPKGPAVRWYTTADHYTRWKILELSFKILSYEYAQRLQRILIIA